MKRVVTVPEDMVGLFRTYFPIKAAIMWFMDACDEAPLILPKIQDPKSWTLSWRSALGCCSVRVSFRFNHWGSPYIENGLWCTDVNILRSTVTNLNATNNVKPETRNRSLETMGLPKPGKTRGLRGPGPGFICQDSAGLGFGQVLNQTNQFLRSKSGPLAAYPDPLATLSRLLNRLPSWLSSLLPSIWPSRLSSTSGL